MRIPDSATHSVVPLSVVAPSKGGCIVAATAGIQGSLYLLVLSINPAVAILRGLTEAPGELPMWGTLAVTTTAVTFLLLANVRGRWEQRS